MFFLREDCNGVDGKYSKDLTFCGIFQVFCSIGFVRCLMLLFLEFFLLENLRWFTEIVYWEGVVQNTAVGLVVNAAKT